MDLLSEPAPDNYDEVRGRNISTNRSVSRNLLMSSARSSVAYHEKMVNNGMNVNEEPVEPTPALSYKMEQEKAIYISKAAKQQENMRPKGRNLEVPNPNPKHIPNMEQCDLPAHGAVFQIEDDNDINI